MTKSSCNICTSKMISSCVLLTGVKCHVAACKTSAHHTYTSINMARY